MPDPNTAFGDDSRVDTKPIYCYIIRQIDIDEVPALFLTSYDGEIEIESMPAAYHAEPIQVFSPANIGHGPIRREGTFDKSTFEIRALTKQITGVSRYAMTGVVPRIQVDVVKINPGRVYAGEPALWGQDTLIVQTGLMHSFGFQGFTVGVECVPEPLYSGQEIPRWRFSRTCNRVLYGIGCNVDPAGFTLETNILALDPSTRTMIIQGTHLEETGNFFRQGVLLHQNTGVRLSIFSSEVQGTDTKLTLHQWSPDLNVPDIVIARAGCRHTIDDCNGKFTNAEN